MKPVFLAILFAPVILGLSQPAEAGLDPTLQPINKWVVDFAETHCTAARAYGSTEEPVVLAFRPSVAENMMRLTVLRSGRASAARHSPVTVEFSGSQVPGTGLSFPTKERKQVVTWIHIAAETFARLKSAGEVTIQIGGEPPLRFALREMPAVVNALVECNDDLRQHWNIAETTTVKIGRPATPLNSSQWLSPGDYPRRAIDESASGTVPFILMVNETGVVEDCGIEGSSGNASLDATGCVRLIERARFQPALDENGNPVRSIYRSRITWRLE
jgi:TonB family protein